MQILYLDFRPRRTGWLLSMQERLKLALAQILLVGRDRPSSRFSRHPLADLLVRTPPHDQTENTHQDHPLQRQAGKASPPRVFLLLDGARYALHFHP